MLTDVFGREAKVGDTIAAGMAYMRSSVLRVGTIVGIKEKGMSYGNYPNTRYSVRVHWTHNGSGADSRSSYFDVKDSTILVESSYNYAKFIILPDGYADEYPSDTDKS